MRPTPRTAVIDHDQEEAYAFNCDSNDDQKLHHQFRRSVLFQLFLEVTVFLKQTE